MYQVDIKANSLLTNVFFVQKLDIIHEIWSNLNLSYTFLRHSQSISLTQYALVYFLAGLRYVQIQQSLIGQVIIKNIDGVKKFTKYANVPLFPSAGYQGSLIHMKKQSLVGNAKMKKMHNMKKLTKYAYVPPFSSGRVSGLAHSDA